MVSDDVFVVQEQRLHDRSNVRPQTEYERAVERSQERLRERDRVFRLRLNPHVQIFSPVNPEARVQKLRTLGLKKENDLLTKGKIESTTYASPHEPRRMRPLKASLR